jgi:ubiquitin-conjugating enzyme E2 A
MSNKFALTRLSKELNKLNTDAKIEGINIEKTDNLFFWKAQIKGPIATPFENGIFDITLTFNSDYPVKPPSVKFLTPMFHPNIYRDGKICIDILQGEWSPVQNIRTILLSILSLLTDPNPDSPANRDAALLYMNDRKTYEEKVKELII